MAPQCNDYLCDCVAVIKSCSLVNLEYGDLQRYMQLKNNLAAKDITRTLEY